MLNEVVGLFLCRYYEVVEGRSSHARLIRHCTPVEPPTVRSFIQRRRMRHAQKRIKRLSCGRENCTTLMVHPMEWLLLLFSIAHIHAMTSLEALHDAWSRTGPWKVSTNHTNACDWYGVVCQDDNNIIALEWQGLGLQGSLSLVNFPDLERIDLSENIHLEFVDWLDAPPLSEVIAISTGISNIEGIEALSESLTSLQLSHSAFTTFPTEIYALTHLARLDAAHLALVPAPLPVELFRQLTDLRTLNLQSSAWTGTIPTEISSLTNLRFLSLSRNAWTGTIPELPITLETLYIEGNDDEQESAKLGGPLPTLHLQRSLTDVRLAHQALTGTLPLNFLEAASLANPHVYTTLDVSFNQLTGAIPAYPLARYDALSLRLQGNQFVSPLPILWCSQNEWNYVDKYGCDAILCDALHYNAYGKQVSDATPCVPCNGTYLGQTECGVVVEEKDDTVDILKELYQATDGANWREPWSALHNSDNTDLDYCSWYGITCHNNNDDDDSHHIQLLHLYDNDLRGTIPARLWTLPGLESLDLSYNRLSLRAPTAVASTLTRVRLSRSDVSHISGLEQAMSLTELHLDGCEFNGDFPTEIYALTNLVTLHLEASYLQGTLSNEISQLTELERLSLNENSLTGSLPTALARMTNLQYLDLSDNSWQGPMVDTSSWNRLRTLLANHAGLGGPLPMLESVTALETLELMHNDFTGTIPDLFLSKQALSSEPVKILLGSNELVGILPERLALLPGATIHLEDNKMERIPSIFCDLDDWMQGAVGDLRASGDSGCDAILCPARTWNAAGRATLQNPCVDCPGNVYMGETRCETKGLRRNAEVDILDQLFRDTGGRYWNTTTTNWTKPGVPICYREGVLCGWKPPDMNSGVTELHLARFGLRGSISSSLFDLPKLRLFDFSHNPIEMGFAGIEKVNILEVAKLVDTQVRSLAGLEKAGILLHDFHLSGSHMGGTFPTELLALTNLEHLSIDENKFEGTIPPEIYSLTSLKKLIFHDNDFTGVLPSEIGVLENLEVLDGRENLLHGKMPTQLGRLSSLKRFSLSNQRGTTKISGPMLPFDTNPLLTQVYLSRNEIKGTIPANLLATTEHNASIRVDLSYNFINGAVPEELHSFNRLNIDLVGNQIDDLPEVLCRKLDWMDGVVRFVNEAERCDAILCPPGSSSPYGRVMSTADSSCKKCPYDDQAPYFGSLACLDRAEASERDILSDFYLKTNGRNWIYADNWFTVKHVCSWAGVKCDERLSVTAISLENNGLQSEPTDDILLRLSELPNLQVRDAGSCS